MRHGNRPRHTGATWLVEAWYCSPCRKRSYGSRKDARKARKARHADDSCVHVYACPDGLGWHLGHVVIPPPTRINLNDPRAVPEQRGAAEAMRRIAGSR